MSYQLTENDICRLITACQCYQEKTGSEYMWDEYEKLVHKLNNYSEETFPSHLECELHNNRETQNGIGHNPGDSHRRTPEQSGQTGREAVGSA